MAWALLVVAGILETVFAIALKASDGFSRLIPSVVFVVASLGSFGLLTMALRTLPVGTAYAIWTGIGAFGTAAVGMIVFHEPATAGRMTCLALIVSGVVGLKVLGGGH